MEARDIAAGVRLVEAANWNQTAREWELFLEFSPKGCFVAESGGEVVGTVTTLNYGPFAWISMVLVDPGQRGQGIGRGLMQAALECLADVPCIRLDATPLGEPVYRKLGFVPEYGILRLERAAQERKEAGRGSRPFEFEEIVEADARAFDADRTMLLRAMAGWAPELCLATSRESYILGRRGRRFVQLGPVIAPDEAAARELVLSSLPEFDAVIDVPEERQSFLEFLKGEGFRVQRPLLRMSRGVAPPLRREAFAIAGPELG